MYTKYLHRPFLGAIVCQELAMLSSALVPGEDEVLARRTRVGLGFRAWFLRSWGLRV